MINIEIADSKNCNGDYSLFITFDYNSAIVEAIKEFPTRFWDKENKSWEVPFNKLGEVVNKLSALGDITISGKYIKLDTDEVQIPKDYVFKTTPFEHQLDGVKFGLNHNKWLLGDEQGLGKTKQVIDIAEVKKVKHCLIVCCVNGLKWNWKNEVATHSDDRAWILGQHTNSCGMYIGSNADRLEDLNHIDELPRFIITNIETLRYKVKTGRKVMQKVNGRLKEVDEYAFPITERLQKLCKSGEIEMIAVDEFHKCKNPDAEQARQILQITAPIQIAMTGTPLMNKPLDLYMPLKWLGYEKHGFWAFKNHHCNFGGYGGHEVVGYKHLEELTDTLDTMMLRRLKDEVLDLPEKTLINEYVEMGSEQARIYAMAHSDIVSNLDKIKMANNPLAELIRLRQATGNPEILSDVTENAKFDRMEELVDDAVENGKKVVIFSNWTQVTNPAFKRLSKKYRGVMITGETKDNLRQEYVNEFQNNDRVKFIIGTIGALGTGLNLFAASTIIFLDHPWNKALYDQAVDRCHRIGQTQKLTIYNLLCKNTIDERIWDIVQKKGQMSEILIDDTTKGDKNALINYLLS